MPRPSVSRNPVGGGDTNTRLKATPIQVNRSTRRLDFRVLTSIPAGKFVPIAAMPLLREDRLQRSRFRINFEMLETVEILMNAINVRVMAYLVPNLAFDRFNGIDQLNRSYQKIPETDVGGATVVPFFETIPFARATMPILTYMGKHAREGQAVNTAYIEAYNKVWNFRAKNRSMDITRRNINTLTLAPAFWNHSRFAHIVPDFDQAIIEGEVPLTLVNPNVPLRGIDLANGYDATRGKVNMFREHTPASPMPGLNQAASVNTVATSNANTAVPTTLRQYVDLTKIVAELQAEGVTVSLANIELARKTQAFAALRRQYAGHNDDYIVDLLMNGIEIPEQQMRQPILLADQATIFGMSKRYASDSVDLTASVVNGATYIDIALSTPVINTGGVVMIFCEIVPEQLFERSMDPYLHLSDQEKLPEFLRDTLDPEKVEVVQNEYIDLDHDVPLGTFGYAPLNHKWNSNPPGIGGKFYRPEVDAAFDEDRQRIWAVETQNPTLAEDFYICRNIHQKPFVVTDQDNFECVMRGVAAIDGNTVFGPLLLEAGDEYEEIMAEAPLDRIDMPESTTKPAPEDGA